MSRGPMRSAHRGNDGRDGPAFTPAESPPFVMVDQQVSPLLARARDYLSNGPAGEVQLVEHICNLPGAPPGVARQIALALFDDVPDVYRDGEGRWSLVRERETPVPSLSERPGRRLDSLSFVVVDVETTGGSPSGGDRITEFGAVTVINGQVADVFETLVNPERPIPAAVTRLTRITWEMVSRAPTIRDVAPRIADVLRGHVFVGHNAAFDWRFVAWELSRYAGCTISGERLCTVRLARAVVPNMRRRTLDSLAYYYGIENHARHRAGGDALATAKVLLRLLDAARERGCDTLEDLRQITRRQSGKRRRHKRRGLPGWTDGEMTA